MEFGSIITYEKNCGLHLLTNQIRKFRRVEKIYLDNAQWYSIYHYFGIWMQIEKLKKAHQYRFLCCHLTAVSKRRKGTSKAQRNEHYQKCVMPIILRSTAPAIIQHTILLPSESINRAVGGVGEPFAAAWRELLVKMLQIFILFLGIPARLSSHCARKPLCS